MATRSTRIFEFEDKTYKVNLGDPALMNRVAGWTEKAKDLQLVDDEEITEEKYDLLASFVKDIIGETQFDDILPDGERDVYVLMDLVVVVAPLFAEAGQLADQTRQRLAASPVFAGK